MIIFKTIITKNLTNKNIKDICDLKDAYWKFGLNSQINFFKKNVKMYDLHNCCFFKGQLIGYTLLKIRFFTIKNKKSKCIHFETLVINKKFRDKKIGNKLMLFNNDTIIAKKLIGFLICNKKMRFFYKKNLWKKADKKFNKINIFKTDYDLMTFNQKKSNLVKIY
jgi:hypothetical protein